MSTSPRSEEAMREGSHHTAETRKKMSEHSTRRGKPNILLGKPLTFETKLKISLSHRGKPGPNLGKHFSPEHRQKISQALSGKYVGDRNAVYGKHWTLSSETRQKMREHSGMRGRTGDKHPRFGTHHTPEAKQKMSEAQRGSRNRMFGKHHTLEARKKISLGKRRKGE
jgi:hypothetical protein